MTNRDFDPLFGTPPEEIPLANAPLARVLAQVQFAPVLSIRSEEFIAPFQERIRSEYPGVEHQTIQLPPFGSGDDIRTLVVWRFLGEAAGWWRVSLTPTFLALETRDYSSRQDFIKRFRTIVSAFKDTVESARATRVGVRYVDHIKTPELDRMADMLRPDMLGIANSSLRPKLQHTVSETVCEVAEGTLLARWGLLPPNGTYDPDVLLPAPQSSWFLDLDVFKQYVEPFGEMDPEAISETALALATRAYSFFRWATTDRFIEVYGGS